METKMNLKRPWNFIRKVLHVFRKSFQEQCLLLAKELYHHLPFSQSWKKRLRGSVRKIVMLPFSIRRKKVPLFEENFSRLNAAYHLSLCAQRIRIRRDLERRNCQTLILLVCQACSVDGLSETLGDLCSWVNGKVDLVVLSDCEIALEEGTQYPPFELIRELPTKSLYRYAEKYSHLIVLRSGDRPEDFALERLLFHLDPDSESIGIYSDYRDGDALHPLPDWDPVLIQFENYIAAPILFKFTEMMRILEGAWDLLPNTLKSSGDWEDFLCQLLKVLPPRSLSHLPEFLFTIASTKTPLPMPLISREQTFSLSIVIPTNGKKLSVLKKCLHSLLTVTDYAAPIEIILLDNSRGQGQDPYYDFLKTLPDRNVKVCPYDHHFNWSAINNFGASLVSGEILLFLNDDTEVTSSDWIANLLDLFKFAWVGVVAPRLVYPDGTIQHAGATLLPYGGGGPPTSVLGLRGFLSPYGTGTPGAFPPSWEHALLQDVTFFNELEGLTNATALSFRKPPTVCRSEKRDSRLSTLHGQR